MLSLFVRLNTSRSRLSFPIVCASTVGNASDCSSSISARRRAVGPLFSAVIGAVPTPVSGSSRPLRFRITVLSCGSFINQVKVNQVFHNGVGINSGISIVGLSNSGGGFQIAGLFNFFNLGHRRVRRTGTNSLVTVSKVRSVGINRAVASSRRPRTLGPLQVSPPALRVAFQAGSSPFTNQRNGFIASHRLRGHLGTRLRASISLQISPASRPNT